MRPAHQRCLAVTEVIAVFALVHIAYRSFKHFTDLGRLETTTRLNFSPGATMIIVTLALLLLARRDFAAYGLTRLNWWRSLNVGLLAALLLVAGAALLAVLKIRPNHPLIPTDMAEGLVGAVGALIVTVLLALILLKDRKVFHSPSPVAITVLVCLLLVVPIAIAMNRGRPLTPLLLMVLWTVFGAGLGEEIFFRGYIQSRVDLAWEKPFRFAAVNFGAGLIVSSLLFGFIHALNTVDYFHGRWHFAWGYGLQSVFVGLYYGVLRERTGGVWAGAVTHSIVDVLARLPGLL
jgi:uncharacterized protein